MKNTSKSAWIYYFLLTSCYYIVGLANIVQGPTNQTACTGALAVFTCVSSTLSTISWQINGLDPVQWNIASPLTKPLSQGSGVTSSLMLPSISAFVGASVVCNDGQENSLPALLRILGSSSPPALMTLPVNDSTSIRIHWTFGSDNVSTLSYYVTIANTSGAVMYNQSQNDDQLVYTPPDTCGSYYAVVTAMYEYLNFTCLQSSSVQLVGAYPTAPLIPTNMFLECSSMSQDNLSISISVLPQQDVCSYKIETSWKSFTTKFSPSSYVQSYPKQSIFNVSLPFNQLINLTIAAFNPYGSNSSSVNINTYEILSVTINTTYPLGRWTADCVFISCSQSIGCLVYLNDTHCAAFKRGFNNSMSVSCPVQYNDSFPGPGGYVVKAFAVHVLSNGSLYHPYAYMEFRVLTNQANTTSTTKGIGTQTNVPTIVGAVLGTVIGIVAAVITVVLIWIFRKKVHYKISTSYAGNPEQRPDATDHEMTRRNKLLGAANDSNDQQSNPPTESSNFNENGKTAIDLAQENGIEDMITALVQYQHKTQPRSTNHEMKPIEELLLGAAKLGDTQRFNDLFDPSNVNLKNQYDQSLLMLASENGHTEVVQKLLSAGAQVDSQDMDQKSSLMLAAGNGHVKVVQMLISAGAQVDLLIKLSKKSSLMLAAEKGHTDVVKKLLLAGAKVDLQDRHEQTSMMLALENGHLEVVKILILHGAKIHADVQDKVKFLLDPNC